jgi:hypothetical protein
LRRSYHCWPTHHIIPSPVEETQRKAGRPDGAARRGRRSLIPPRAPLECAGTPDKPRPGLWRLIRRGSSAISPRRHAWSRRWRVGGISQGERHLLRREGRAPAGNYPRCESRRNPPRPPVKKQGRPETRPVRGGDKELDAPRSPRRRWPEVSQLKRTWLAGGADIVTKPSGTAVFIGAPARVGVPSLAPASRTTARSRASAPLFSVAAAVRASRGSDAQGRRDCRSRRRRTCFG